MQLAANILLRKRLPVTATVVTDELTPTSNYVTAVIGEMMAVGYRPSAELFEALQTASPAYLTSLRNQIVNEIGKVVVDVSTYQPLYASWPNIPNVDHFWHWLNSGFAKMGHQLFDGSVQVGNRTFTVDDYNKLIEVQYYDGSETDYISTLFAGRQPFSPFEKRAVQDALENGFFVEDYRKIVFGENKAFVAAYFYANHNVIPTQLNATDILKMIHVANGGEAKLSKENKPKFKYANKPQSRALKTALDNLLESQTFRTQESFKTYLFEWKRVFRAHSFKRRTLVPYKRLRHYANMVWKQPSALKTFEGRISELLSAKSPEVFSLLRNNRGYFARNLNRVANTFGMDHTFDQFMGMNPSTKQLVDLYNYFQGRIRSTERSAVLASERRSRVSTYGSLEGLGETAVRGYQSRIRKAVTPIFEGKTYVDPRLYLRPLSTNNRAASTSITGASTGTIWDIPEDAKFVIPFVAWKGSRDVDLSAHLIGMGKPMKKIGWNSDYQTLGGAVVYSGDNQGIRAKNAEAVSIDIDKALALGYEWVIMDAQAYGGGWTFKGNSVNSGFMASATKPSDFSKLWYPSDLQNAALSDCDAKNVLLLAVNLRDRKVVYLDVSLKDSLNGSRSVSNEASAQKALEFTMKYYVPSGVTTNWTRINQGHLLEMLSAELTDDPAKADRVFDENTTSAEVSSFL